MRWRIKTLKKKLHKQTTNTTLSNNEIIYKRRTKTSMKKEHTSTLDEEPILIGLEEKHIQTNPTYKQPK